MKFSTREHSFPFRTTGGFDRREHTTEGKVPGEIFCFELAVTVAPHTEGKGWLELDFEDALELRDELTRLIEKAECPLCHRKGGGSSHGR